MLTVSELADFFNISTQTVRYYDKIGLLKPSSVDPNTGYRYYGEERLDDMYLIKSLKSMGLSLEEIKGYLQMKDIENLETMLKHEIRTIAKKRDELKAMQEHAEFVLSKLRLSKKTYQENTYERKFIGPRVVYLLQLNFQMQELYRYIDILYQSYGNSTLRKNPRDVGRIVLTISEQNLQKQKFRVYNGIGFLMNAPFHDSAAAVLPSGEYLVTYHIGSYATIHNTYRKLFQYAQKNGLQVCGPSAEISVIDNTYTNNENEYVTQIQFIVQ